MPDGVFAVSSVLTPEQELVATDARAIVARSSDRDFTVLEGHTPLIADVVPGDVRIDPAEGEAVHLAVHGGYLQVETGTGLDGIEGRSTRVTLLAGIAELARDIDVDRAERAREVAVALVEELRAATGRGGGAPGAGAAGAPGGGDAAREVAPSTPEELELAEAEAGLARAELRLQVAGAATS